MSLLIEVATDPCFVCHKAGKVVVDKDGYDRWKAGEFIQNALPTLSADEREQLMTGTHGPCFDSICPEEDEDDFEEWYKGEVFP